ncbi:hypothetical protein [Roseovarius sp.]|uniref:hypothetical protein n=1 Tax=Roseovarius sp. TaxID=1486281 RepID=UPI00356A2A6B
MNMKAATKAIRFPESRSIPEGPKAGHDVRLAPFQKQFVKGALADDVNVAVLSIGRGNAKTALSAGIAFDFVVGFIGSLPVDEQAAFMIRRSPRLEVEYDGDGGGHFVRAIAADGKTALGSAPTVVLMDERGALASGSGDALEHALLSGLGTRRSKNTVHRLDELFRF